MKNIYRLLAILLGYGIIIASFIIFGESLDDKIKILDIIVSCLVYTLFIQFLIFPLVNLNKSAHKEVGMMGFQFTLLPVCSLYYRIGYCLPSLVRTSVDRAIDCFVYIVVGAFYCSSFRRQSDTDPSKRASYDGG